MFRAFFYYLTFIFAIGSLPSQALAQDGPEQILTPEQILIDVSGKVLQAVRKHRDSYETAPDILQAKLLGLLNPTVDFAAFSQGVMGSYYKQATPAQRSEFSGAFKATLVELYTSALVASDIEDITVASVSSKTPNRANVVMKAVSGNHNSYTLQYSMRLSADDGKWRMRNIILDGVNVGLTYRNQFKSAVETENQDLARVITLWPKIIEGE